MKLNAIEALIRSNFINNNPSEIIDKIRVKFSYSCNDAYAFEACVITDYNHFHYDIYINFNDETLVTVDLHLSDVLAFLNVEYGKVQMNPHDADDQYYTFNFNDTAGYIHISIVEAGVFKIGGK